MRLLTRVAFGISGIAALSLAACREEPQPVPSGIVVSSAVTLPLDPQDDAWDQTPEYVTQLVPQDMVEPRQMTPTTPEVLVRALTNGTDLAIRLEWEDASTDDVPALARFSDACAIQFPDDSGPSIPAPQMGEPGRPVAITYWRAAWQSIVDGRAGELKDLYPNASIDHYPFNAASLEPGSPPQKAMETRYAPARALHNVMAGPRESPVEDLVAEGPGTLTPADSNGSRGKGVRTPTGWAVVLARPMPFQLTGPAHRQVAVAVWDGAQDETGARKMRTAWVSMVVEDKP